MDALTQLRLDESRFAMSRDLPVRDVMRLFLPPVLEDMMQVQRPLPKNYQLWLDGFNAAKEDYREHQSLSRPDV